MAARKKQAPTRSSKKAKSGSTRLKAAEAAPAAEADAEEGGMGIDDGIVLTTSLLLAGACVLVYFALGSYPA